MPAIARCKRRQGRERDQDEEERTGEGRSKGMLQEFRRIQGNSEFVIKHKTSRISGRFRKAPFMGQGYSIHGTGQSGKNIPICGRMNPGGVNEITNI